MMNNILVLCTGNSCRSQMAHGFLERLLEGKALVYSAGLHAHGVNARAIQVMQEIGIDISNHTSNEVTEYSDVRFDWIITVCDHARENCPYLPGDAKRLHHEFTDPALATGPEQQVLEEFRRTRDEIRAFCIGFARRFTAKEL